MKKGLFLLTSLTALVLLTSCGKHGTNLPEKYKGFIDYAYGKDGYTVEEIYSSEETGWYVTFSDKNGNEHSNQLFSDNYENNKEYFDSKETMDMASVNSMYKEAVSVSAEWDVYEQIIRKYLECEPNGERFVLSTGDGFTLNLLFESVVDESDKRCHDDIEKRISGRECLKVTEADGRTVGSDKEYILQFNMQIRDESKKDELLEKAEAIISDYEEYVRTPQNYDFRVWLVDENGEITETLAESYLLFGENFDIDAKRAELGRKYYSLTSAVTDALYGE